MNIEEFKEVKWSGDTYIRITNELVYDELMYRGNEALQVLDVDFRDGSLGIDFRGEYMRVPCEDIEIAEK